MKTRFLLQAAAVEAAALAAIFFFWDRLPASIPVHWNIHGAIDGWAPRTAIFAFSLLIAGLALLWAWLPGLSPRRYDVERFGAVWWRSGLVVLVLLGFVQMVLLRSALGTPVAVDRALAGGIALAVVLLGNMLGKVRRNFWLGVRTPWTLADDRVWYATHRMAGKTMVAGGVLALGALLAGLAPMVAIGLVAAGALVPAGYSLVVYRRLV
jgi:uncharacterized membrane protein